jgi:EAL domain-containing protein (putative c-di-GMP-specific phosphodiesterase class I)
MSQNSVPIEYDSWEAAFRALLAPLRQQSLRVADYTREIFLAACDRPFAKQNIRAKAEIRADLADVAYQCGLLHQIGKATLPAVYQQCEAASSKSEQSIYRTYPAAGKEISKAIQEKLEAAYQSEDRERLSLSCQMIEEACEQHMERMNGSGWPSGSLGKSISPIAQIVGLAKELDRLASETKDEAPFDKALEQLYAQSGELWEPALIGVLHGCEEECRRVYQRFLYYTLELPQTVHLVEKREKRPLGLKYRPLVSDRSGTVAAYEAVPWYATVKNENKREEIQNVDEMLVRTGLSERIGTYFLYEAADTLYRIQNCKLNLKGILLNLPKTFFGNTSQLKLFTQLFEDQPVPRGMLMVTVPSAAVIGCTKGREENLKRLLRYEVELVLDDYDPQKVPIDLLENFGFTYVRLSPEAGSRPETAAALETLRELNFKIIGKNADSKQELSRQLKQGVVFTGGTYTGALVDEDGLIRDSLLREVSS